jgi:hypothetical protein
MPRELWALVVLCVLALTRGASAQHIPVGGEFQVNSYTEGGQLSPDVSSDASGSFVVVWDSIVQDGDLNGVFGRLFSSGGDPLAAEFQVNSYTPSGQQGGSVAMQTDGEFVVAWWSAGGQDGSSDGIFARRFSSAGAPLTAEFQINESTIGVQRGPSVAAAADGDFFVTWHSLDASLYGIFARRFSSDGTSLGSEFQVNTYITNDQRYPSVTATPAGEFVIVWQSKNQDGSGYGVFARRFSDSGAPLGSDFQVNTYTSAGQVFPSVGSDDDGDFVVAWESPDGSLSGIFARRFSSAGDPLATEFQLNTYTADRQEDASVATAGDGSFVIAWQSRDQDNSYYGVFARHFSSAGASLATEFQVNTRTAGSQDYPSVAAGIGGSFVVAWSGYSEVFAQRFGEPITLDVDGDGSAEPLTDGLLVLRYLFGFRGAVLVAGAVDLVDCTRCDAASIESYLQVIGSGQ